jgi:hypothetical protein
MEEKILELLEELYEYATNVDSYEYGLPMYDYRIEGMKEIIYKFLAKVNIDPSPTLE